MRVGDDKEYSSNKQISVVYDYLSVLVCCWSSVVKVRHCRAEYLR